MAPSPAYGPGLVLTTLGLDPIYSNGAAVQILGYPSAHTDGCNIHACIRRILRADHFSIALTPAAFQSGRRQYVCRSLLLESHAAGVVGPQLVALLLERHARGLAADQEIGRRFNLSPRESETVRHLVHGLTTKEVAQRMSVSPNTVKQFVRIAMGKLGVTTRSGIVGKVLSS